MAVTTKYIHAADAGAFELPGYTDQNNPDALGLSNGGFVIAYTADLGDSASATVLTFYDAARNVVAQEKVANQGSSFLVGTPSVTQLSNGNVLVVWDEDGNGPGILARMFTQQGSPIGDEFMIAGGNAATDPQVAALENGGFAVSYTLSGDIVVARFDDNGSLFNTIARAGSQSDSAIAALADGGYIVTYTDNSPIDPEIRGAIYNANGTVRKADFLIGTTGDNTQSKVVGLPNGNFAVVYTDSGWGSDGDSGITMQIFDANGANVTPDTYIHVNTPSPVQDDLPNVAVLPNGFIAVTWSKNVGSNEDIYGRIFDQDGNAISIEGIGTGEFALVPSGGTTTNSAVAALKDGTFVTTWDNGNSTSGEVSSTVSQLVRISNGDDADDTIVSDDLRDIVNGGGGEDTAVFSQSLDKYALRDFGDKIVVTGPDGTDTLTSIEHLQFTDGTVHVNDGNPLFDTAYYMSHNLDVFHAGVNALDHYNANGRFEGRDPNAFFDTSAYLAAHKDVAASGMNPLQHYDQIGWKLGYDPSANFDTKLYLVHNPDVAAAGGDPLAHYLAHGMAEGRQAYAAIGQTISNGLDAEYYLMHNPDVAAAGVDPWAHYSANGWHEGRNPNAYFDTAGYLSHNPDVAAAGVNPLEHYMSNGWHEGRDASASFDTAGYLAANPDVAAAGVNPLQHFLQFGIYEGRQLGNDGIWG